MPLEAVAGRLAQLQATWAGEPLEAVAEARKLERVRSQLKALARELREAVEKDPAAPVPVSPAEAEYWALHIYDPAVQAEALSRLGVASEAPAPPTEAPAPPTSSPVADFLRDVGRGVAVGVAVGYLLQWLGRRK